MLVVCSIGLMLLAELFPALSYKASLAPRKDLNMQKKMLKELLCSNLVLNLPQATYWPSLARFNANFVSNA